MRTVSILKALPRLFFAIAVMAAPRPSPAQYPDAPLPAERFNRTEETLRDTIQNPAEAPPPTAPEHYPASEQTSAQNPAPAQTPAPQPAPAQTTTPQPTQAQTQGPPPNIENTAEAAEPLPRRDLVHWNEYQGPHFTIRVGAGFLYDFAAFAQDEQSKEQIKMLPGEKVRDARIIMGGRFPSLKLPTTWCVGVMYDGPANTFYVRQTGIQVRDPQDPQLLLPRASKRGVLSQQGHGRLRRLDHGEIHDERRDHSAAGRRYQVAWLFEAARLPVEPRLLQRCRV